MQFSDTISGLTETYDNRNAGRGKTLSVAAGYTVNDGNSGNNYNVTTVPDTTGVISKAPLTITAVANTKVYDATTSAIATPTTSGLQGSDTVTGLSETYDNHHVGTGKTLSVAGYTVNDGNGGNNYPVTTVPNVTGVITAAGTAVTLTVTPNSQQYSDKIDLSALTASSPGIGGSVSFYINHGTGTQQLPGPVSVAANGTDNLTGVALLETVAGSMSPGAHTVKAVFTPSDLLNYSSSSNTAALNLVSQATLA